MREKKFQRKPSRIAIETCCGLLTFSQSHTWLVQHCTANTQQFLVPLASCHKQDKVV